MHNFNIKRFRMDKEQAKINNSGQAKSGKKWADKAAVQLRA